MTFYDGANQIGQAVPVSTSGGATTATLSWAALSVSAGHAIKAVYSGDGNFSTSTGSTTQAVNQAATTTTVSAAPAPSVFGQGVTFTATVSVNAPGTAVNASPTGTVTFYDGANQIGQAVPVSTSGGVTTATLSWAALSVSASHAIKAVYSGDGNFSTSTGSTTQAVNQAATTTTVSAAPAPSVFGQGVTFTATVSVNAPGTAVNASPTGTVTFYDGAQPNRSGGHSVSTSGGVTTATLTWAALSVAASHAIKAVYSGDGNFSTSTGSTTQAVQRGPPHHDRLRRACPSVFGQARDLHGHGQCQHARSTINASPTGTVTFYDGANQIGQAVSVSTSGGVTTATLSWAALSVSAGHAIKAVYSGDGNFSTSTGSTTQTVNQDATTTTASASANTDAFGQTLTFTAIVAANAPGSGTPTGSVDFFDSTTGNDLGSVGLSSGSAALSTPALPVGSQTITVSYSGDGNFIASTTAITVSVGTSVFVLNSTASGSLSLSGNASIDVPGIVVVDSNSTTALSASGNAQVTASSIQVVGGFRKTGNAIFSPTPTTGIKPLADPLAGLAAPSGGTSQGSVNLTNGSKTINPGIYSQINVSGNANLTLNPGVYVIAGGGFNVSGNARVSGSGVMIYNAGSKFPSTGGSFGPISLSGNGNIQLSAPTTGPYADILIFQSRDNTQPITLSGNGSLAMNGTIYAPVALLTMSGNGKETQPLVVNQLNMSGNASSTFAATGSGTCALGSRTCSRAAGFLLLCRRSPHPPPRK